MANATIGKLLVSIHAPAWGATSIGVVEGGMDKFQFTLPHGERPGRLARYSTCKSFNSRSRMGSDHQQPSSSFSDPSFNSRSRMGSDR